MIKYELEGLTKDNFQYQVLHTVEMICEEYRLTDHFGTISMALHEMGELISDHLDDATVNVDFMIRNEDLSVAFHSNHISLDFLKEYFSDSDTYKPDSVFTITLLTDKIEIDQDDQAFTITFHVKPLLKGFMEARDSVMDRSRGEVERENKMDQSTDNSHHA